MIYVNQEGTRAIASDQLCGGRTEYDEESGLWEVGWEADGGVPDSDMYYVPMAAYHAKEDAELVDALRKWADYKAGLSTFRYPSVDEATALREQIVELLER